MIRTVLMTADTVGGVWTYALDLARALQPLGANVALATMGAPVSGDQAAEAASITNLELVESDFKLEWMEEPWADVDEAGEWLLGLEQHFRPDVVHLNGYTHGSLPWSAPVVTMCHSCVLSWWEAVKGEKAPAAWEEYSRRVRDGLRASDLVLAPTWTMLAEADRFYGPFHWAEVVPNARGRELFKPLFKESFVFSAGRAWDEAKNVAALNKAAAGLPCPVFLAGDGGDERHRNVVQLGRLSTEELACWLGRASIYALPARYEPFGLSVLEAAMSGCALVLGDIPSLRENWADAAIFVDPNDSEGLHAELRRLLSNPKEAERLGQLALEKSARFDLPSMGERYLELYNEVATRRSDMTSLGERVMVI